MLKKIKISMPQAIVVAVVVAAFAAVYVFAPEDRDTIEKAVLAVWGLLSTFLAPLLGRHEHTHDDDEGGDT